MKTPRSAFVAVLGISLALFATACSSSGTADVDSAASTTSPAIEEPTTTEDHSHDEGDGEEGEVHADSAEVDLTRFFDGAIDVDTPTVECTLSDGATTDCYQITIAGYPVDGEIGPFCPTTIDDTAEDVGIWFDGDATYDLDGDFIVALPEIYGDDAWQLYDDDGNVNVTETLEAFEGAARPDVEPEYQNHCVEGKVEWLEGGVPVKSTVEIPITPIPADGPTQLRGSVGITLNGVTIDGQAPVDAILGAYTIAAFDDCGAHLNPFAGYHMHGATGCSEAEDPGDGDTPQFGYALDGYPIHSPLDAEAAAVADLDECNGHTSEVSGYHYHANEAKENAVLTCLTGLAVATTGRP